MNWQSSFSAFSPRVSSTTLESGISSSDSSPEQKGLGVSGLSPSSDSDVPLSRTHQYKKITKPLLERKRRARINKCLDELKDIMTVALQAEGENVSKLEKADILELTVRHLHKLSQSRRLLVRNPLEDLQKFQAGYSSCAQEAATFLLSTPGVDVRLGQRLLSHLSTSAGPAMAANLTSPNLPLPHRRVSPPPSPPQHQLPLLPKAGEGEGPVTVTQGSFTLSIRRQTPEPLTERNQNEKSVPIRPAAIRLNPVKQEHIEPVWRPYTST